MENQAPPPIPQPKYWVGDRAWWLVMSDDFVFVESSEHPPARIIEVEVAGVRVETEYYDGPEWAVLYSLRHGDRHVGEGDLFGAEDEAVAEARRRIDTAVQKRISDLQARPDLAVVLPVIRIPQEDADGEG